MTQSFVALLECVVGFERLGVFGPNCGFQYPASAGHWLRDNNPTLIFRAKSSDERDDKRHWGGQKCSDLPQGTGQAQAP